MSPVLPAVALRPPVLDDAGTIAGWATDPCLRRRAGWDPTRSVAEIQAHHERLIREPPAGLLRLAVESEGVLVGYADLHGHGPHERELGFLVGGRERWGRGLGTALARAALEHAFGVLGVGPVTAGVAGDNEASLRLVRRIGLRERGQDGPGRDVAPPAVRLFELTADEHRGRD